MVKHTAICDKCKKEKDLKQDFILLDKSNNIPVYKIPDGWEEFGVFPKYLLCNCCASELNGKISTLTYEFVEKEIIVTTN